MTNKKTSVKKAGVFSFLKTQQTQTIIGSFLLLFSLFLTIAFISFFFNWQEDQSTLTQIADSTVKSKNWLGKIGAKLSHFFIYKGFGIGAFIIPFQLFLTGVYWIFQKKFSKIVISWNWGLLAMLWISITLGFLQKKYALLSGVIGFEINEYLRAFLGKTGLIILLLFCLIVYIVIRFKITLHEFIGKIKQKIAERKAKKLENKEKEVFNKPFAESSEKKDTSEFELKVENLQPTIDKHSEISAKKDDLTLDIQNTIEEENTEDVDINIAVHHKEEHSKINLSDKLVADFGEFDPTLELANFKFPTFNLLKEYNDTISIDPEELEANKDKIVETLKNYKIGIDRIKATVGPTITLYEIVPEAGVRISKIKNLEDDIALSLSALGIRIIAPMPGKGTIGIEVPNKKSTIVSMHSVISSKKFQESHMELPIALG
ncbi:MAG: DNA translocase FtsK 4TM domain-containing protein, partial [Polaribacter sp.]